MKNTANIRCGDTPPLPKEARLSEAADEKAKDAGKWLTTYVGYAQKRSPMTPTLFHQSAGLWVISTAIARRLFVQLPHDRIWPNLYLLWVALSTLFAKTTGMKVARELVSDAIPHLLLPSEWTPEALLAEMAGVKPEGIAKLPKPTRDLWEAQRVFAAQRGLLRDEFSGLLASAGKDYNKGLTEYICHWHDCPEEWTRRTQMGGLVVLSDVYFGILSATTPAALAPYLHDSAWLSGFWPRFVLLFEGKRPPFKRTVEVPSRPEVLVQCLSTLAGEMLEIPAFPDPPNARSIVLTQEAEQAWGAYDKALRYDLLTPQLDQTLWASYGRFPTLAIKVAAIIAAMDWNGTGQPVITLGGYAKAQSIVESWRKSLHLLLEEIRKGAIERMEERIIGLMAMHDGRLSQTELTSRLGRHKKQRDKWEPVLEALKREGRVKLTPEKTDKPGPKPKVYVLVK